MENDQSNCSQGSGPGSLLCQTRVAQGLSREEVAQRLHLAPRQIQLLENDDYANLPGPTYVRGYLRGYANLLGLKPEQVLAAYATLSGSSRRQNLTSLAPKEEITSQDQQIKFATYAVIAIVLGLAMTWWQGRDADSDRPPAEKVATLPSSMDPPLSIPGESVSPPASPNTTVAPPFGQTAPATPPAVPAPVRPNVPAPTVVVPPRERPAPPSTPPTPSTGAPTDAPAAATRATGPEIRAEMVVYTEEESWLDVRDGLQNKLIYETVPAGRRVPLQGAAPLKVFIGNAPGVRIEFNGKPYDISPYKRGLIARFTLGQELAPDADTPVAR